MKTSNFCKAARAALLLFVLCGLSEQAQNETSPKQDSVIRKFSYGVGISESISGSGLGVNISPYFFICRKRSSFSIGPNMQMIKGNFSGIRCSYEYTSDTIPFCKNLEAYFHSTVIRHTAAYLNSNAIEREREFSENYSRKSVVGIENWKFKTLEYSVGMGLRKKFNDLAISASIGIGGFHTYHNPALWDGWLKRERTIAIVQFQTGIMYSF